MVTSHPLGSSSPQRREGRSEYETHKPSWLNRALNRQSKGFNPGVQVSRRVIRRDHARSEIDSPRRAAGHVLHGRCINQFLKGGVLQING